MTKFFRGGGTIADTLNAVPNAIDRMLKENYKKVAIIDTNATAVSIKDPAVPNTDFRITAKNININFQPKFFILEFTAWGTNNILSSPLVLDTRKNMLDSYLAGSTGYKILTENVRFKKENNELNIYGKYKDEPATIKLTSIIAIE